MDLRTGLASSVTGWRVVSIAALMTVVVVGCVGLEAPPPGEALQVELVAPAHGALLVGTISLRAAVAPEEAVVAVIFRADGESLATVLQPPFEVLVDTRGLGDGVHELEAEALSTGGDGVATMVSVTVDNENPLLVLQEPRQDELLFSDAPLRVRVVVADGAGVDRVLFRAEGEVALEQELLQPEAEIEASFPIEDLFPSGVEDLRSVTISVTARDSLGRVSETAAGVSVQPRLKWVFDTLGEISQSPTVTSDGTVLVASRSGDVIALDRDGVERCRFDGTADEPAISTPVPSPDESMFYFGTERFLRAIDTNCVLSWTYAVEGVYFSTPAVDPTTGTIFAASYAGNVSAIAPNGSEIWTVPIGLAGIEASLVVDPAVGTLYVGSLDYRLHALAMADGSELWSFLTGREVYAAPTLDGDRLVLASADDYVYAISRTDGSDLWPIGYETDGPIRSPAAVAPDGTIYVASQDMDLHAVAAGGTPLWTADVGAVDRAGPAVADDGTIVVGSTSGAILGFAPDGTPLWSYQTYDAIQATPVIVDGIAYVGSWDRRVYALYVHPGAAAADNASP